MADDVFKGASKPQKVGLQQT